MIVEGFVPMAEDLQGWNGESPMFSDMVQETKPSVILEVGTWKGQSTVSLANACKKLDLFTTIYCIDTWLGSLEFRQNESYLGKTWDRMLVHGYPSVYYQFLSNMIHRGIVDMIEPVPAISREGCRFVPDAELIYLDAGHDYRSVKEDLWSYWPKLKDGGIIFGDDYFLVGGSAPRKGDGYLPEVRRAVDEFAEMNRLQVITKYDNFWYIKK